MKPLSYGMLFLAWGVAQTIAVAALLWTLYPRFAWLPWAALCGLAVLAGLTSSHRRAGPAGRGASALMIACLIVGLLAMLSRGTSAFPFLGIMLLLGRNFTLSTRRDLYFNLAICVVLFTEPLSHPPGAALWIFGLLFLLSLVAVLLADYADQRIAQSLPADAARVPRELMTAGNLGFVALAIVAVGMLIFLVLPQPRPFDIMAWRDLRAAYTHIPPPQDNGGAGKPAAPGQGGVGTGGRPGGRAGGGSRGGGAAAGEGKAAAGGGSDTLFEVVSDRKLYLRTGTLDRYESGRWSGPERAVTTLKGIYRFILPGGERQDMVPYGIEILKEMPGIIPTALRPQYIRTDAQVIHVGPDNTVSLDDSLLPGRIIYAESVMAYRGKRPASDPMPLANYEAMRALPADQEHALIEQARRLGRGRSTALRRAEAMEEHLRTDFTVVPAAQSEDPIDLLKNKSGPPRAFAAALTLLLRADGIPARVAEGYRVRRFNPFAQRYVVTERDAHAWVEAHVDSRWVVFEPLPGAPLPGQDSAQSLFETLEDRLEILLEDLRSGQAGLEREDWLKRLLLQAPEMLVAALVALLRYGPWALAAAVMAYLLMKRLGKSFARLADWADRYRLWRHRDDEPVRRVLLVHELAERACRRRGVPRGRTENHAEHAAAVIDRHPHLAVPISLISDLFGAARYGPGGVSDAAARRARAAYLELLRYIDLKPAA